MHGNTTLEIAWTVDSGAHSDVHRRPDGPDDLPARRRRRSADALQVEVIGHQWWWEFRYPQYKVTTANELYLPDRPHGELHAARPQDVLHSFWIPQLGGKRDLITNHTNYLWFTPDSLGDDGVQRQAATSTAARRTRTCASARSP